jgi:LysR family transcriptional regulator, nod-box dependent transcriptional activator
MRFKGLDLNLLVAFDALMELKSVTRAAERLHLSQAAMSAALGRLRDFFSDEILVVQGKRMFPTAFAQNLSSQVQHCLREIDQMMVTSSAFDPAVSQRTFRVVSSDYISVVVLVPLIAHLRHIAPGVTIEALLTSDIVQKQIENGDVDLLITPEDYVSPDLPTELLFAENHVVVGCLKNPRLHGDISEQDFLAAGHVTVSIGNQRTASFADKNLAAIGKIRRIEVTAPSFTMVPWLLIDTPRLAVMAERLARTMASRFDIAYGPLPFPLPVMREMVQFHFTRRTDAGLVWFREQLSAAASLSNPTN